MKSVKVALLLLAAVVAAGCSATAPQPSVSNAAQPMASGSAAAAGTTACAYVADGAASRAVNPPPTTNVSATGSTAYTIQLDGRPVRITLKTASAPCTVNSFISLAAQGFYDNTRCHRLGDVPGFQMLQCGDPTATGSGGPGYRFNDELTGSETYPAGTLAMANSGPNTNGSQFFLVFGDSQLSPNYTVFGTIDPAGIAALKQIAAQGSDNAEGTGVGHPRASAKISAVTPG